MRTIGGTGLKECVIFACVVAILCTGAGVTNASGDCNGKTGGAGRSGMFTIEVSF